MLVYPKRTRLDGAKTWPKLLILYRLVLQIKKLIKQTLPYKKSLIHDSCQLAKKDLDMSGLFCYKWVEIIFEIAFIFSFPCLFRTYLSSILILLHFESQWKSLWTFNESQNNNVTTSQYIVTHCALKSSRQCRLVLM